MRELIGWWTSVALCDLNALCRPRRAEMPLMNFIEALFGVVSIQSG